MCPTVPTSPSRSTNCSIGHVRRERRSARRGGASGLRTRTSTDAAASAWATCGTWAGPRSSCALASRRPTRSSACSARPNGQTPPSTCNCSSGWHPGCCRWLAAVVVRYAVRVNGLTGLAVTKLDVLDSFSEIPVCVGYRCAGESLDAMPAEVERLARVEPVYESLPGWQKSLSHVRRLADLPPPARAYLDRLQDLAHAPIEYVSVGSHRDRSE